MKKDQWQAKQHARNFKAFVELAKRIVAGKLQIMSITIDTEQFGHSRVTLFVSEAENENDQG